MLEIFNSIIASLSITDAGYGFLTLIAIYIIGRLLKYFLDWICNIICKFLFACGRRFKNMATEKTINVLDNYMNSYNSRRAEAKGSEKKLRKNHLSERSMEKREDKTIFDRTSNPFE